MTYAEELICEGEIKGEIKGQVEMIEKLLGAGVSWSTIEHATGINAEKFAVLKRELAQLRTISLLGGPLRSQAN